MRHLRWRDGVATLLVALIGVPYVGYLMQGEMPFVQDPRGMSVIGLALGAAAWFVARRRDEEQDRVRTAQTLLGIAALVVGAVAVALAETAAAEALLAIFMVTIAVVWATTMLHHARMLPRGSTMTAAHR